MRRFVIIGLLFSMLVACENDETVVYILFDNSEGLSTGNDVLLNGVRVGKVLDVDLTKDNEVITTVELTSSTDFPTGSLFEIQSKDLFTKCIHVTLSDSKSMIHSGDTIQGVLTIDPIQQIPCSTPKPKIFNDVKEMLKN